MPLSLNPFSSLLSSAKSAISSVTNIASGVSRGIGGGEFTGDFGGGFGAGVSKGLSDLSNTVNRLGGGIGSALNGMSVGGFESIGTALKGLGGISNAAGDIGRAINGIGVGGLAGSVGNIAGAISSAAGQLNNVLSLFRGRNLPSNAELFSARGALVELQPGNAEDWRVRINCNFALFGGAFSRLEETSGVVWPYMPKISISTKANYQPIDPVHSNYPFNAYKNSVVEDIQISGEFSCETESDAHYWLETTTFFKSATKMFYGASDNAGNPPVICNLSGYGPGILNSIPVIIKSFSMEMPDDVNYIKVNGSQGPTWVPIISNISITVSPIYNRSRLREFSLQDYANGGKDSRGYI
jgi:hypothetical protein